MEVTFGVPGTREVGTVWLGTMHQNKIINVGTQQQFERCIVCVCVCDVQMYVNTLQSTNSLLIESHFYSINSTVHCTIQVTIASTILG
jgi:hypothetical protein